MIKIEGEERAALIAEINRRIDADTQIVGAAERTEVWERGWSEAAQKFRNNPVEESLIPAFVRSGQPVRWKQEFWHPDENQNELTHIRYMQKWIAAWLEDCGHIAEFGCGTGFNLVALAKMFPDKYFTGYDFAQSAVDLVHQVAWALNLKIDAKGFDMKYPVEWMPDNSGVFTFGAIEQLAGDFKVFMEYLLINKPKIVVHVEPTIELYDPANEVDALAIRFHRKRGYTVGLLPWLQNDPRVKMIHVERTGFGSLMMESYNLLVWRHI